jgi:hypothetical protein
MTARSRPGSRRTVLRRLIGMEAAFSAAISWPAARPKRYVAGATPPASTFVIASGGCGRAKK